ncbi:unnamed protein product [Linum tenue]|uniref:CCHC-type domain-containing protein n=1 Tax=Linum tenue TaxID=586396 RepID=A0AAV0RNF1_9ROSI|nr:unnamed protein product [Linum tenue]CAI0559131.1 unnamed protein product [Linum tenue]
MTFLMKLRPEFEGIRSSLLHRNITRLEDVLGELIRQETRLRSQAKIDLHEADNSATVFSVSGRSSAAPLARSSQVMVGSSAGDQSVYAVRSNRPRFHRSANGQVICFYCRELGHVKLHCPKRIECNYCKEAGHKIAACPILAKKGRAQVGTSHRGAAPAPAYATATAPLAPAGFTSDSIHQMLQEVVRDAFPSALGSVFTAGQENGEGAGPRD